MYSNEDKARIRHYLGYPDLFRYKNPRLESALLAHDSTAEDQTIADLEVLALVEAKLSGQALDVSGVAQVDVIRLIEGGTIKDVQKIGRIYVGRISVRFGVPPYSDVFGTQGYLGDSFTDGGWLAGGRGGRTIPLG